MNPIVMVALGFVAGMTFEKNQGSSAPSAKSLPALPPSERPLAVGPQCSSWSVIDQERLDLVFRFVYADMRLRGVDDPFQIANGVMELLAPECRVWGGRPRNMAELDLYVGVFRDVAQDLLTDGAIAEVDYQQATTVLDTWYEDQRRRLTGEGVP